MVKITYVIKYMPPWGVYSIGQGAIIRASHSSFMLYNTEVILGRALSRDGKYFVFESSSGKDFAYVKCNKPRALR